MPHADRCRRRALALAVLGLAAAAGPLVPAPAVCQPPEPLPRHPRELRFDPAGPALPSAEGRRHELPGGAVAYFAVDRTLPLFEITVALGVGSFLDPADRVGLASFTGAMLRRGGAGERTANEFDEHLDALGVRLDSSAGLTRGGASLSALSAVESQALDALFDMLARPGFQADRLASAHANLLQSLARRNDDPLALLEREWEWLLHGADHFATRPVTPASIAPATHDAMIEHHRRFWRPERMVFAVSGDFEPRAMAGELSRRAAAWRETLAGAPPPGAPQAPAGGAPFTPTPGLYHVEADLPQAKVALGHRAAALDWQDADRPLLEVANELLGGRGAISRLAGRLRTAEGLVYRASSRYQPEGETPGDFRLFFDTRPSGAARAVSIAIEELRRLRAAEAEPRELEVVKQTLLGRLRLAFDTAEEVAGWFAEDELLGRPHAYWERYRQGIETASAAAVRRAAETYFDPGRLVVLVVGPWRELSGGAAPGASELERAAGHVAVHLPARDPLTLEPLPAAPGR